MKTSINLARSIVVGRGCVRGSPSGRKEKGPCASLSQVFLCLGGHWSFVPSAYLPMPVLPSCSGTGYARFWEVEEIPRVKQMSKERRQCVEHYDTTTYVADDGRITVCLPFKSEALPSNNFQTAKQRSFALERKLKDHDNVKQQYRDFSKENVDMGHLGQAPQTHGLCYCLPHHCVFKDSTTTKLRVVFDGSSKSLNGNSLNDCLLLGPRLQDDLFDILIRFRLDQFALSADVAKCTDKWL